MNKCLLLFLSVLLFFSLFLCNKYRNANYTTQDADTVVLVKYDTICFESPIYVDRVVKDTIYVKVNADSVKKDTQNNAFYVKLEREQVHYSENGVYDAWVSGFKPRLDSFFIYNKETTTSIFLKDQNTKKRDYYTYITYKRCHNSNFMGVGVQSVGRKFLVGGEVGILDKHMFYGINLGVRINE